MASLSYVGVYLTYVAIPLIVFSGLLMVFTKSKQEKKEVVKKKSPLSEVIKTTTSGLEQISGALDEANTNLERFNKTQALITERTRMQRNKVLDLRKQKIEPEINLRYTKNESERTEIKGLIADVDSRIKEIEKEIEEIKRRCEIEVAREFATSSIGK